MWMRRAELKQISRSASGAASCILAGMIVQNLEQQAPFTTKDGSTIRSILDRTNAPVQNQSLAEASVPAGAATQRHYHRLAEELYFILEGSGEMEIDGEARTVGPGDCVLIPPGAWHTIAARESLRFLCCCAPPYSHEDTFFE
jgi:mannose-6-phosphate isomerase-like protein (cupin superfamily)